MTAKKNALIRTGVTVVLAAAFGGASVTSAAAAVGLASPGTLVEAVGTGSASAAADQMTFTYCVYTDAPTVSAALEENNEVASKLQVKLLANYGVAKADTQTTGFTIGPDDNYAAPQPTGQPTVTGYHVQDCLRSILRDLSKDGAVLDAVAAIGGNDIQIPSIQFGVSDTAALDSSARDAAYSDADAKVTQDAQNAGLNTCIPDTVTDNGGPEDFRPPVADAGAPQAVPLSGGEVTRQITISVAERCY